MGLFALFMVIVVFVRWTQTVTVQGQLSAYLPLEQPPSIHAQIAGGSARGMSMRGYWYSV